MKTWFAALVLTILGAGMSAGAQDAPPLSAAQFEKIEKFLDTIGSKEEFPAPTAQSLGLSNDPAKALPVVSIVTDDHRVYFCRSRLNKNDYIVWVRSPGNESSYMFATRANLKLLHALHLKTNAFPEQPDITSPQIQGMYRDALAALAADVDKSRLP